MPVAFTPYLERIRSELRSDGAERTEGEPTEGPKGLPKRRVALAAVVAGILAALAVRRVRNGEEPSGDEPPRDGSAGEDATGDGPTTDDPSTTPADPSPRTRLRRVGRGWIRR